MEQTIQSIQSTLMALMIVGLMGLGSCVAAKIRKATERANGLPK